MKSRIFLLSLLIGAAITLAGQACSPPQRTAGPCSPPQGVSGSPNRVEDVVSLLNSLPKPVTVACFLQSLDRPLELIASTSSASAQPSPHPSSPRLFIFKGDLVITVVPEGSSGEIVEFSTRISQTRSVKAELDFPVTETLDPAAPYNKIRSGTGTSCRFCHSSESRHSAISFAEAFESEIIWPNPSSLVPLSQLSLLHQYCNSDSERCEVFSGIFDHGPVRQRGLPY